MILLSVYWTWQLPLQLFSPLLPFSHAHPLRVELGLSRHQSASEPDLKLAWSVLKFVLLVQRSSSAVELYSDAGFSILRSTLPVSIPVLR